MVNLLHRALRSPDPSSFQEIRNRYHHRICGTVKFRDKKLRDKKLGWVGKNPFSYFLNLGGVFETKPLGVWWCVWVSGGVSAHRSLRIYGSPRRTIILICPPECVFGPPEYGELMGQQQPPEYAGGPKNVPILVVLRNSCGWVTKISKKMVFLSRNSTVCMILNQH